MYDTQSLIDTGQAWSLEGSVGRACMEAIQSGEAVLGPKPVRDYWGNLVPAWWMVKPGDIGSPEYARRERPTEPSVDRQRNLCAAVGVEVLR